jgi:hypothetical protein
VRKIALPLTALFCSPLLLAPNASASEDAQANSDEQGENQLVCKLRIQTGTRFKKKVCRTAGQWEAMSEAHRRGWEEMANRPVMGRNEKEGSGRPF